jgi:hypothetical protein
MFPLPLCPCPIMRRPRPWSADGETDQAAGSRTASLDLAYVGNVASLGDFRRTPVQCGLSVFSQRRVDALDILFQAWINFIYKSAQAGWIEAKIARSGKYDPAESPESSANLFTVLIQPLE